MNRAAGIVGLATWLTACDGGDITGLGCFGGVLPIIVVYGLAACTLAGLAMAFRKMMRWARLAREADASVDPSERPLREGPAVLRGRVCPEEASAPAHVEIHQTGSESSDSSGNWTHRWEEKERRLFVRPFVMELASGEKIQVEPTEKAVLADALDGKVRVNKTARILKAELTPGEDLIASGRLARRPVSDGYRGTKDTWTLVSPGRGEEPMLLSTEPLGDRFRARMRGASTAIGLTLVGLCALHAVTMGFHTRLWVGHSVRAETVDVRSWVTYDSDNNAHQHRLLTVQLPDGQEFAEEIAHLRPTRPVYVRVVPGWADANSLGRTATAHWLILLLHTLFPLVALGLFGSLTPRRWYEGRKQSSKGSGRLR